MRAAGGSSSTGTASETSATTGTSTEPLAAKAQAAVRETILDVLSRGSNAEQPSIKACIAGLYKSLVPLLAPAQLRDSFLVAIKRLAHDRDATVVKSAVRALATVYSAQQADDLVRADVNTEVNSLLKAGPKDIIIEILRALMRTIPSAPPSLRDDFMLNCIIELSQKVVAAADAASNAMRDLAGA